MTLVKYPFLSLLVLLLAGSHLPASAEDPVLVYETTVTGYYLASGQGVAVDSQGNAFVIGGAIGDANDILVTKLDPAGKVLWKKEIRGSAIDYATDITLDAAGDVVIVGWTDSEDFPVVGGLGATLTGFRDAFVMKLSSLDGGIVFSTLLGGDYTDEARGVAVDAAGQIYVVGSTGSTDFPTVNPIQGALNGFPYAYTDAFVTRLSADATTILYSTYLGGTRDDVAVGVALDAAGKIYLLGETDSTDFPLQAPIQPQNAGGQSDLFVTCLTSDGASLSFSTYLGGEDWDRAGAIALDASGAPYVGGTTRSIGFPTTPGAFQETFAGEILGCEVPFGGSYNCEDMFVTKLTPDGAGLAWSTYLGGNRPDELRDLAVDGLSRPRVVGYTNSHDFPPSGVLTAAEIVVSQLSSDGSELDYTFTKQSASANAGHGIAVGPSGDTFFSGAVDAPSNLYVGRLTTDYVLPDVAVTISSNMTEVPRGGTFVFDIEVTNREPVPVKFQLWTVIAYLPIGAVVEPAKGPVPLALAPGETRVFSDVRQSLSTAPFGTYRYVVRVGKLASSLVFDEDFVEFDVVNR